MSGNQSFVHSSAVGRLDAGILALRQGYMDVYNNKPFDNKMTFGRAEICMNYEQGRLIAKNIQSAGLKLVSWNADMIPPKVLGLIRQATRLVGPCMFKARVVRKHK